MQRIKQLFIRTKHFHGSQEAPNWCADADEGVILVRCYFVRMCCPEQQYTFIVHIISRNRLIRRRTWIALSNSCRSILIISSCGGVVAIITGGRLGGSIFSWIAIVVGGGWGWCVLLIILISGCCVTASFYALREEFKIVLEDIYFLPEAAAGGIKKHVGEIRLVDICTYLGIVIWSRWKVWIRFQLIGVVFPFLKSWTDFFVIGPNLFQTFHQFIVSLSQLLFFVSRVMKSSRRDNKIKQAVYQIYQQYLREILGKQKHTIHCVLV